ncbi:dihydrolipoyllysine-residue acetyltransferase [Amphritea balenae]|uniref:Dihydrolipoamide acetyltransferase component of pyruvate dehydrogenase complex n=1 Tax=Amphritea balenae TaxID=452629 RepID=A0A3P1SQL9_9GAMM|nr:dihydrolipoyllysine-residue acetyltransferase [Amphritea balenae]RRC98935.1 dihydrolipoyllysine-residue acetyltransferase [Amphritea balenae]GGK63026.1 dihydrolipoamide acetyltransferase component of pyruvate dehydrogenase complex [Amphritea balenae]
MLKDFILPDIGEGIVECEVVEWLIKEGDLIEEDQPIVDVMTDKALVQIPAPYAGRVSKLYYQQGDSAKVHERLFEIELNGVESVSEVVSAPEHTVEPVAAQPPEAVVSQSEDFILPDIGEGIVECEVVEWLIKEGDHIEEDQPVVDLMTDKAVVQIPAPTAGTVLKLYHPQGDIAQVHQPLFSIQPDHQTAPEVKSVESRAIQSNALESKPEPASALAASTNPVASAPAPAASIAGRGKALAGPAVRRICREFGLDIQVIPGSGKDGRVMKEDVIAYRDGLSTAPESQPAPTVPTTASAPVVASGEIRVEPIRGIKAAMAKQMTLATSTIPHFTFGDEVNVTALLALRKQLKPKAEQLGVRLTLMPFIMKAMAMAIQQYPVLNSRVNADCTEIHYLPDCNIGMAVDSKIGLLVPNIKRVDKLSILEIAAEVQRLTEAAREGRVQQQDLQGGTISISNIGALGGTYAVPVVNAPEVAIVALGKVQQLPRFDDAGQVEARSIMNISWSGDHRVIDGGTIARFSGLWQSYLEDPASMLLDLS